MKSKKDPFISWPARKPEGGGKWIDQILVKKQVKDIINKDLLDRYKKLQSEGSSDKDESGW